MNTFDDVLAANAEYQQSFVDPGLPGRAAKGLAVVTCMDSRIDPLGLLGLAPGDAKILRTAGARVTDDVLRSLVLAHYLLGVERVMVLAHTDCGMAKARDEDVHAAVRAQAGIDSRSLEFRTIADQDATLQADVQRVRSSPYLPADMPVVGGVYDVRTGAVTITVP
ncbi:beta-class carbonic anhydrase [Motilibacter aurantiacus]|uniref:beta-class carbonic anhydrase n=1 Tax=Motilibacter aurantiacus TaxID=2714955 RepID=UPI002F2B3D92